MALSRKEIESVLGPIDDDLVAELIEIWGIGRGPQRGLGLAP